MRDRYQDRLFYAKLSRFAYTSSDSDLSGVKLIDECENASIRFCYFLDESTGTRYLAIRGTDNAENAIIDFMMVGGLSLLSFGAGIGGVIGTEAALRTIVMQTLIFFEKKHGECAAATGHSLGGKLLEFLPDRIKCVAFNAFNNNDCHNISSVRMQGDIAGSHTDHWISNRVFIDPKNSHAIDNMIATLESSSQNSPALFRPRRSPSPEKNSVEKMLSNFRRLF